MYLDKLSRGREMTVEFSVAGTGKTYTGIKLVYLFDLINDMLRVDGHSHQQVVFCGPNNKSVDLVASKI